jgi:uncharacterized short protein YbdD (DUF466 family)
VSARGVAAFWHRLAAAWAAIVGAPDYERYVAAMDRRRLDSPLLSAAEFAAEREAARVKSGTRCC